MVLSYYIYKYPYAFLWYLHGLFRKKDIYFYCADPLDYEMFTPIKKYLDDVEIVAKNKKTKLYLDYIGIRYKSMPVFPKLVIMARHSHYKFPVKKIVKIGFDHGLYQFKRWTSSKNYNSFDIYFVSSNEQVKTALSLGITTTKAIGYPKLDRAFNGEYNNNYLKNIKIKAGISSSKKTILFTSTWDTNGLSALDRWINKVHTLTDRYNILLTAHTWTAKNKLDKLRNVKGAFFIEEFDVTPYLMIADIFVGDYNSLIGEFCALDKPIITFTVPESKKTIPKVMKMIKDISIQISSFEEIDEAISKCLSNPDEKSRERNRANDILFYRLDGKAGERAAEEIMKFVK